MDSFKNGRKVIILFNKFSRLCVENISLLILCHCNFSYIVVHIPAEQSLSTVPVPYSHIWKNYGIKLPINRPLVLPICHLCLKKMRKATCCVLHHKCKFLTHGNNSLTLNGFEPMWLAILGLLVRRINHLTKLPHEL